MAITHGRNTGIQVSVIFNFVFQTPVKNVEPIVIDVSENVGEKLSMPIITTPSILAKASVITTTPVIVKPSLVASAPLTAKVAIKRLTSTDINATAPIKRRPSTDIIVTAPIKRYTSTDVIATPPLKRRTSTDDSQKNNKKQRCKFLAFGCTNKLTGYPAVVA